MKDRVPLSWSEFGCRSHAVLHMWYQVCPESSTSLPYALPGVGDATPRSADRARSHAASAASGTGTVTRLAIGCSYYGVRFL